MPIRYSSRNRQIVKRTLNWYSTPPLYIRHKAAHALASFATRAPVYRSSTCPRNAHHTAKSGLRLKEYASPKFAVIQTSVRGFPLKHHHPVDQNTCRTLFASINSPSGSPNAWLQYPTEGEATTASVVISQFPSKAREKKKRKKKKKKGRLRILRLHLLLLLFSADTDRVRDACDLPNSHLQRDCNTGSQRLDKG